VDLLGWLGASPGFVRSSKPGNGHFVNDVKNTDDPLAESTAAETRLGKSSFGQVLNHVHRSPLALVIGDVNRAEVRPLVEWLKINLGSSDRLIQSRDLANATTALAANQFPDLIVVLQAWSHEYSSAEINGLFSFAPLARIVVCYGAWCESDGRNCDAWPLAVRVPLWAAVARIQSEWQLISVAAQPPPLLWSASREEIFAAETDIVLPWSEPQSICIDSPDAAYHRFLCELMTSRGQRVTSTDPTLLLFDVDPWGPFRAQSLESLRQQHPRAELCVLMSLASPKDLAEFQQLGIHHVIHKLGFRTWPGDGADGC
jgi:hypothetical protein